MKCIHSVQSHPLLAIGATSCILQRQLMTAYVQMIRSCSYSVNGLWLSHESSLFGSTPGCSFVSFRDRQMLFSSFGVEVNQRTVTLEWGRL